MSSSLQPYIGSPIAEEDADAEVASYAAFSDDMNLLVDPANEVLPQGFCHALAMMLMLYRQSPLV